MAGDKNTLNQGILAPGGTFENNTINFVQASEKIDIDFDAIIGDIDKTRKHVQLLPETDESELALANLTMAKQAARDKNKAKLIEHLKAGGRVVGEAVKEIAATTLSKVIAQASGMPPG